ncbi:MAG: 23S rRNA (guanosine(2251)-2'-O)-methyltransferase RlmB, partial [Crocinitomicaceae bacterium]|nr:23S rRNA (guanosine(2251)-2'-O)-methyltransferase RlmB [Crocinitomicaceae bacterium]
MERRHNDRNDRGDRREGGRGQYRAIKDDYIFGVRSVIEAVKSDRVLNKIFIQKGMDKDLFMELKDALADGNH